jgi:AraC family transcriptional regulator, regulatory protein of adaptative response / DNA-3-methyladenine glycosylase II
MDMDPRICYRAVLSRDPRFDGRFFTGVLTTGVYCRPVCPARTPKQENVRFFACAAAAEQEGFRPCLRCRPDTAPGTPAWAGTSATVSRALRLIAEGSLDTGSVDDLAERLGIGARHMRRLFDEHLGASPVAIAQTRRVHFARKLIDESDLPMAELALCAGFSSVRRFNSALRRAFGRPPGELRRQTAKSRKRSVPGAMALKLPFRPPYDWDAILRFLRARAIPGVESVDDRVYRRSITVAGSAGSIEVSRPPRESHLILSLRVTATAELPRIVERARRLFDLGADPLPIVKHLARDPRLASSVRAHPGMRLPGAWDAFELAVRAILGQQVTVKGASTQAGRLVRAFGVAVETSDSPGITHLFPTPEILAKADLADAGLTGQRAGTIHALAVAARDHVIDLDEPGEPVDAMDRLLAIPGIGPWTASYIAMRAFGDPDVMPPGDLGLRKALGRVSGPTTDREVALLARAWRPWRSYASVYLWSTLQ